MSEKRSIFSNELCENEGFRSWIWKARFLVLLQSLLSVSWSSIPVCCRALTLKKQKQKREIRRETLTVEKKNHFQPFNNNSAEFSTFSDNCICNRGPCFRFTKKWLNPRCMHFFFSTNTKNCICVFFVRSTWKCSSL